VNAVTSFWPVRTNAAPAAAPTFAAVAEEHLDDVYRYLLYLTKDASLAEDLTSATFERALRTWKRFDRRRASAVTWLCQLARSTALDHFRAEARRRRREERYARDEVEAREDTDSLAGFSPALARALASLSAAEREVVALRVVLELDPETTADVLGISRTACSTRLNRALRKLEEKVEADVVA
jgi:RNA polymerase sigma-70 factor, ECF subfamily